MNNFKMTKWQNELMQNDKMNRGKMTKTNKGKMTKWINAKWINDKMNKCKMTNE